MHFDLELFWNGEWRDSQNNTETENLKPATGEVFAQLANVTLKMSSGKGSL